MPHKFTRRHKSQRSADRNRNRFEKYRVFIALLAVVVAVVALELASYAVIVAKGHQERRRQYPYNRMVSGYTVFKNVPGYDMGSSTLRELPSDPDVILDEFGFYSDGSFSVEKPDNTVRIFVLGGSTAFGAGQNAKYHGVHIYADGVHSYPRSIAGQLKNFLSKRDRTVNYEVINAAAYQRQFHQSTILYLETISRMSPDYVVNIEGWNDISSLVSGTPYADAEEFLPAIIDLRTKAGSWLNRSNTLYVLSTAYDKYKVHRTQASDTVTTSSGWATSNDEYSKRKEKYVAAGRRFEQLLRHHVSVLHADNVQLVFVLQPMLPRTEPNKVFSNIEQKFLDHFRALTDDDSAYVVEYFISDYFESRCRRIVESAGEMFIDANKELASVDASVELYTDYCHLTAAGNEIIARMVGQKILESQIDK